jgi:hypothetical protein
VPLPVSPPERTTAMQFHVDAVVNGKIIHIGTYREQRNADTIARSWAAWDGADAARVRPESWVGRRWEASPPIVYVRNVVPFPARPEVPPAA